MKCPICENTVFEKIFTFSAPPLIETRYESLANTKYHRETWKCGNCGHFVDSNEMDLSAIYSGEYVNATYKDITGVINTFNRIISLHPNKSDNTGRVERLNEFCKKYWGDNHHLTVLDVGAGLGVFPYLMKKSGWKVTALDPDARAIEHIKNNVGVDCICGDFFDIKSGQKFDLITFNKVLEHVNDPIAMLHKSKDNLTNDGLVYVEVPDGDIASLDGSEREEFTIDHLHIFSFISLALTADKAGFYPLTIERLQEPSTKYTLRAFLKQKD